MSVAVPAWIEVRCQTAGCGGTKVAHVRWLAGRGPIEVKWRCRKCHQEQIQQVDYE